MGIYWPASGSSMILYNRVKIMVGDNNNPKWIDGEGWHVFIATHTQIIRMKKTG